MEKNFLYNLLYYYYFTNEKIVLYITFSNIISLLLPDRQTSYF